MTGIVIGRYVSVFCRNCRSKPVVSDPAVWKRYINIFLDLLQDETVFEALASLKRWLANQALTHVNNVSGEKVEAVISVHFRERFFC